MQHIQIYNAPPDTGLNTWTIILMLEELALPFDIIWISYGDMKNEPYISINPNGRLPSIVDPNTSVTIFESGACIQYLISKYDIDHKLSYSQEDHPREHWACASWLHLQMSSQGPMFGQKMWFTRFHRGKNLTSVLERYGNEVRRILGVIDAHLRKQRKQGDGHPWLVGTKCTYADLAYVMWDLLLLAKLFPDGDLNVETEYPAFFQWHQRVTGRPIVRKVIEMREESMQAMDGDMIAAFT